MELILHQHRELANIKGCQFSVPIITLLLYFFFHKAPQFSVTVYFEIDLFLLTRVKDLK